MFEHNCLVVSPDEFDTRFRKDALIARFDSEAAETAYEKRDSFLIFLINQLVQRTFDSEEVDSLFVGDNWWPDHTRHIETTVKQCTLHFLTALRALLTNEFSEYRIQICVYDSLSQNSEYIGSMALYADRVLIESKLFEALKHIQSA
jgi:hypothetical protein